jgi:hypothetical protein
MARHRSIWRFFGYQNHMSIDRGFGFIRKWSATDAAAYEALWLTALLLRADDSGV